MISCGLEGRGGCWECSVHGNDGEPCMLQASWWSLHHGQCLTCSSWWGAGFLSWLPFVHSAARPLAAWGLLCSEAVLISRRLPPQQQCCLWSTPLSGSRNCNLLQYYIGLEWKNQWLLSLHPIVEVGSFHHNVLPWYNCTSWLGVKHQHTYSNAMLRLAPK